MNKFEVKFFDNLQQHENRWKHTEEYENYLVYVWDHKMNYERIIPDFMALGKVDRGKKLHLLIIQFR